MTKTAAIIVAAGVGSRFGSRKQFEPLDGKPLYTHPVSTFSSVKGISKIIIAVPKDAVGRLRKIHSGDAAITVVAGGEKRFDSVANALAEVPSSAEIVLVHDAARPLASRELVAAVISAAAEHGAAIAAVGATDTVKISRDGEFISRTIPRADVWLAQTPQAFRREIIMKAYETVDESATDDSYLAEKIGVKVRIVKGEQSNFKITSPRDIANAQAALDALEHKKSKHHSKTGGKK